MGSQLSNLLHYRMNPKERAEIKRQVDVDDLALTSPFEIVQGFAPRAPIDFVPLSPNIRISASADSFAKHHEFNEDDYIMWRNKPNTDVTWIFEEELQTLDSDLLEHYSHANSLVERSFKSGIIDRDRDARPISTYSRHNRRDLVDLFKVRGKFALSDAYEDHFFLPKGKFVLVTHRRVLLLQQPSHIMAQRKFNPARDPCSVLWDVLWDGLAAMELVHGKKDNPRSSPSQLVLYLQTRSMESKESIRVIKCTRDSEQAAEIYISIEQVMNAFGPKHSKVMKKKMVAKPYSPHSTDISSGVPRHSGIWSTQDTSTEIPCSPTFGTVATQTQFEERKVVVSGALFSAVKGRYVVTPFVVSPFARSRVSSSTSAANFPSTTDSPVVLSSPPLLNLRQRVHANFIGSLVKSFSFGKRGF
ncbi:hypothetical protein ACLOJK_023017 [Asimina triloba]